MFERFTDRARRVIVLAQEEARLLNHNYIGTEHILLGLLHEGEAVAAMAITSLGVNLEDAREEVETIIGAGTTPPSGNIPFTPRAKKVLEFSLREALQLGHNYIGTEHILLGLLREGEGVGAQVLRARGLRLPAVRARILQLLSGRSGDPVEFERLEKASIRAAQEPDFPFPEDAEGTIRGEEGEPPYCSTCGSSLVGNLMLHKLPVTQSGEEVEATIVACGICGRALGTL